MSEKTGGGMTKYFHPSLICFSASLFFFYEIVQLAIFNTLSINFVTSFSLSTLQLSHLSASYLIACAIFLLPAGLLLDRFSTRNLLVITALLCVFGTFLLGISSSFFIAIVGRTLTGIGNGFAFLGSMRLVTRWFPPHKIALAIGLSVTIGMLGGVVAQSPFAELVAAIGWRPAMFINTLIGALITANIFFTVKDKPEKPLFEEPIRASVKQLPFWKNLTLAVSKPHNWLCGLYTFLLDLPIMLIGALWGNLYLTEGRHFSVATAGNITGFIFLGLIIGSPLFGWISNKINNRRIPMTFASIALIVIMFPIIYASLSPSFLGILFGLMGLFSGAQVLTYSIVSETNERHLESTCLGFVAVLMNLCSAGSQIFFAHLIQASGKNEMISGPHLHTLAQYQSALLFMPIAFAISLIISCFLPYTEKTWIPQPSRGTTS